MNVMFFFSLFVVPFTCDSSIFVSHEQSYKNIMNRHRSPCIGLPFYFFFGRLLSMPWHTHTTRRYWVFPLSFLFWKFTNFFLSFCFFSHFTLLLCVERAFDPKKKKAHTHTIHKFYPIQFTCFCFSPSSTTTNLTSENITQINNYNHKSKR